MTALITRIVYRRDQCARSLGQAVASLARFSCAEAQGEFHKMADFKSGDFVSSSTTVFTAKIITDYQLLDETASFV